MLCPLCKIEMHQKNLKNVQLDQCDKCRGMWFDNDELRKSKDAVDADLSWMDFEIWKHQDKFRVDQREISCPKCSKKLVAIDYGDTKIKIDYCPSCKGTWLDKGEFKKIIKALRDELLTKSFSDYIKTSLHEAKEVVTGEESFVSEWKDLTVVLKIMQLRLFVEHPSLTDTVVAMQKSLPG